ncbi:MAG: ribosome-associated translation inhibitor RaiA [Bacteroidetes bacterium]|nr:ribosome-associated translation inhibitor RaiA [Bacteroidota bacterium]
MEVTISSLHFKADAKLENFVREKLSKVASLFDGVIGSEVTLKLNQSSSNENKIAEIKIIIPGNDLFAKKQAKTFEEAVDSTIDALKKQLQRRKEKIRGI